MIYFQGVNSKPFDKNDAYAASSAAGPPAPLPPCLIATRTAVAGAQRMHIGLIYFVFPTQPATRQIEGWTEAAHS